MTEHKQLRDDPFRTRRYVGNYYDRPGLREAVKIANEATGFNVTVLDGPMPRNVDFPSYDPDKSGHEADGKPFVGLMFCPTHGDHGPFWREFEKHHDVTAAVKPLRRGKRRTS